MTASGYRWSLADEAAATSAKSTIDTALGFPRQPTAPGQYYGGTAIASACYQSGQYLSELIGVAKPSGANRVLWGATTVQPDRMIDITEDDPFDVVLIAGASNARGNSETRDAGVDISDALQWRTNDQPDALSGELLETRMSAANEPLEHFAGPGGSAIGFGAAFARDYISTTLAAGRRLLLVGCASNGSRLISGDAGWDTSTGDLYAGMISRALAAVAAIPGSALVGVLWTMEGDAIDSVATATYQAAFDAMIAQSRTDLGVADLPWVLSALPDGFTTGLAGEYKTMILDTPSRVSHVATASVTGLATHDGAHYTAAAYRTLGARYYTALAGLL